MKKKINSSLSNCCPDDLSFINPNSLSVNSTGVCNGNGTTTVEYKFTFTQKANCGAIKIEINFGDGSPAEFYIFPNVNLLTPRTHVFSHDYVCPSNIQFPIPAITSFSVTYQCVSFDSQNNETVCVDQRHDVRIKFCCPPISVTYHLGNCDPSNFFRDVTFNSSFYLAVGNTLELYWKFGDGTISQTSPYVGIGSTLQFDTSHQYQCGPAAQYTAILHAKLNGNDCPPQYFIISVPCCPTSSCCPELNIEYDLLDCPDPMHRLVRLKFQTFNIPIGCKQITAYWEFGDGSPNSQPVVYYEQDNPIICASIDHLYECGSSYTIKLHTLHFDDMCTPQELTINIPCCPADCCPTFNLSTKDLGCEGECRNTKVYYGITPVSALNCPPINGAISFQGPTPISAINIVNSAPLVGNFITCLLPGTYTATFTLTTPTGCGSYTQNFTVAQCPDCCPSFQIAVEPLNCVDQKRNVNFSYTVTPSNDVNCPDVSISGKITFTGATTIAQININDSSLSGVCTYLLTPGNYTATLTLTAPSGCQTVTQNFTVAQCPNCCPDLNIYYYFIGDCVNCKRQVQVYYSVSPSSNSECLNINISGNVSFQGVGQSFNGPVQNQLLFSGFLSPGSFSVIMNTNNPQGCGPKTLQVVVPPCCPTAEFEDTVGKDCVESDDGVLVRDVTINATITPASGCQDITYTAYIDGDDTGLNGTLQQNTVSIEYNGQHTCGNHIVTIGYSNGCVNTYNFCVPQCEKDVCKIKRIAFITAISTFITTFLLWLCSFIVVALGPISSLLLFIMGTSFAATVIAFVAWKICPPKCKDKCKPCPKKLAIWEILGIVLLLFLLLGSSVFTALFYFLIGLFSFLSPIIAAILAIIIIIILVLIAILIVYFFFMQWRNACCPTKCDIWRYLLEAIIICGACYATIIGNISSSANLLIWVVNSTNISFILMGWLGLIIYIKKVLVCGD